MKEKSNTIVILHGWGLSACIFAPLTDAFIRKGYKVLTPDLPGFGKSALPEKPLTLNDYAQFLRDYLKTRTSSKVILIGHSFGGRVSLRYQKKYPQDVAALILTGTPGFTPIPKRKLLLFIALAKLGKFLFTLPPLNYVKDPVRRWYYYFVGAKEFFRAEGAMRQTFKNIVQEELIADMESVTCPCLLLWGELDIIVPISIAHRMEHAITKSQLIIVPDADHGLPFKQPEVFVTYGERFLTTL